MLAKTSGLSERYLEELLRAAALHGYLTYTPGSDPVSKSWDSGIEAMGGDTFALGPGLEEVLFDEDSPQYYGNEVSLPMFLAGAPFDRLVQAFQDDSVFLTLCMGRSFLSLWRKLIKRSIRLRLKNG